jgi:hypothetical protein
VRNAADPTARPKTNTTRTPVTVRTESGRAEPSRAEDRLAGRSDGEVGDTHHRTRNQGRGMLRSGWVRYALEGDSSFSHE